MAKKRRKICRVHDYDDPPRIMGKQVTYRCVDCDFQIVYTFADPPSYWGVPWAYGAKNWLVHK